MNAKDIIIKKRDKHVLSQQELEFMVQGYTNDTIKDYHFSAFLMACLLNGLNTVETSNLTKLMLNSGSRLSYPDRKSDVFVDKHSTGGVGDKTSFVIAPLVACFGLYDPMISGRGLGHTGGTLDKLESIKGYNVNINEEQFKKVMFENGFAMMGQTKDIAPADKKIYALRDVTGCAESIPLITASILSKKLAEGLNSLVIDTKSGVGAFMKTIDESRALARSLVDTAKELGLKAVALITDMNCPLGYATGNFFEIQEIVNCITPDTAKKYWQFDESSGKFSGICGDMMEVSLALTCEMVVMGNKAKDTKEAMKMCVAKIESGEVLKRFVKNIEQQGGDAKWLYDNLNTNYGQIMYEFKAKDDGFVADINALSFGNALILLGGGRMQKEDEIEGNTGFIFEKKNGDVVKKGDTIVKIYCNKTKESNIKQVLNMVDEAIVLTKDVAKVNKFRGIIEKLQ